MSRVWMSSVFNNQRIGYKLGTRTKLYGRDWDPENGPIPRDAKDYIDGIRRYGLGMTLTREEMPEAAAVFNEKYFNRVGDLFAEGGIFVVRGKLAETLSRFDLGEGGLVPFPIYKADLETPYDDEFFLLNFGAIKNSILPEQCEDARKLAVDHKTGLQHWKINYLNEEGDVVLSSSALKGADLWVEETVFNKIFMSAALAQAIIDIGMEKAFDLHPCTIAHDGPIDNRSGRIAA